MTTTCEALTMGVPVVTLPVDRSTARYSESILRFMGLPELVARDGDDYVRIATGLAADPGRLGAMRRDLRPRLERTVGDAPGLAARFEAAIRGAWREWCRAQT
jgi:predicted O-linked N-acetylglucosamine transferase (SPINDLY family)